MFAEILSIMSPVFICAIIGYAWVRMGNSYDTEFVSKLVMNIGAPCLIYSTFMSIELEPDAFWRMAGTAFLSMLAFGLIAFAVLHLFKLNLRAFLPGQVCANTGNMGLPLCLLAFGDEGLALGLTYFTVSSVIGFTFGMAISSGQISFKQIFTNAIVWSVVITLILVFSGIEPPAWIYNTTKLISGFTIPLMLFTLGVSLAKFKVASFKRSISLSVMRLAVGFLVSICLASFIGLEGAAKGVLILQCSMPVAVFSYMFALRYRQEPEEVAATVVISTILCFMFLPLLLWYVLLPS